MNFLRKKQVLFYDSAALLRESDSDVRRAVRFEPIMNPDWWIPSLAWTWPCTDFSRAQMRTDKGEPVCSVSWAKSSGPLAPEQEITVWAIDCWSSGLRMSPPTLTLRPPPASQACWCFTWTSSWDGTRTSPPPSTTLLWRSATCPPSWGPSSPTPGWASTSTALLTGIHSDA